MGTLQTLSAKRCCTFALQTFPKSNQTTSGINRIPLIRVFPLELFFELTEHSFLLVQFVRHRILAPFGCILIEMILSQAYLSPETSSALSRKTKGLLYIEKPLFVDKGCHEMYTTKRILDTLYVKCLEQNNNRATRWFILYPVSNCKMTKFKA